MSQESRAVLALRRTVLSNRQEMCSINEGYLC